MSVVHCILKEVIKDNKELLGLTECNVSATSVNLWERRKEDTPEMTSQEEMVR